MMILRDRVTHRATQAGDDLATMRGQLTHRSAAMEPVGGGTFHFVESLSALTEPYAWPVGEYLVHASGTFKITAALPRYRNGAVHHVTVELERPS